MMDDPSRFCQVSDTGMQLPAHTDSVTVTLPQCLLCAAGQYSKRCREVENQILLV